MIGKILGALIGVVGVLWLGIAGAFGLYKYERLPVGWPNYELKCCLVVRLTLHAPYAGAVTAIDSQLAALQAKEAAAVALAARVVAQDAAIGAQAAQHDETAQAAIVVRYRTLTKEIPSVLTLQTDARFPVPWGSVRLFNAGATGVDLSAISLPAGAADDAASPVTASQLADGFIGNDKICAANAQRLSDLQAWNAATVANHAAPK